MSEQGYKDYAKSFREMADRIDLNKEQGFSGAFVIVPPDGDRVELLLLNNKAEVAMFWGLVQSKAAIALNELQDSQHNTGFGGRRG